MYSLQFLLNSVNLQIDRALADSDFHSTQLVPLNQTLSLYRTHTAKNPLGEPLAILYLIARAWGRPPDQQMVHIGAFCTMYLLALDLIDDVQDEDLQGKPHEALGPAIAVNNGLALLFLALRELRRGGVVAGVPDVTRFYLSAFNRASIAAVGGQHRDLCGLAVAKTPEEILEMQKKKTSSLSLFLESASLLADCSEKNQALYRRIGENLAMLVQVRDDVRDIYGKEVSPDLSTEKMTYPLACLLQDADEALVGQFAALRHGLPDTLPEIRRLLYDSGAIGRSAEAIERFRRAIHCDIAATGMDNAFHRTFLDLVDQLAESVYSPAPVAETEHSWRPPGPFHVWVRQCLEDFSQSMAQYGPPAPPRLRPWHLPQWLYDAERRTIFYPDVEGLKEEILPFHASLLGMDDLDRVETVLHAQVPVVLAHEMFHYWRDQAGRLTSDHWHEEYAANRLAVAYTGAFNPDGLAASGDIARDVTARFATMIDSDVEAILARCSAPSAAAEGYGMDIVKLAVTGLEMVRRLIEEKPGLPETVAKLLGGREA